MGKTGRENAMSTTLWYDRFVDDWNNALPLGNGRIGAMLYGNPLRVSLAEGETVVLRFDT